MKKQHDLHKVKTSTYSQAFMINWVPEITEKTTLTRQ